jgi:tetratricopeptide (TPR) repeat protein
MSPATLGLFVLILPFAALTAKAGIQGVGLSYFNEGVRYHDAGDLKTAAHQYRAALRLDPELVSAAINLGIIHEKWRENEIAEKLYNEAVRVAPQSFAARYNRGQFLQKKGDLSGARADYAVALELMPLELSVAAAATQPPPVASLYINLAAIEIKLFEKDRDVQRLKEAEKKLNTATRLKSKSPALYFNKARLFELMNAPARARQFYEEAMRHYAPQSVEYQTCMLRAERLSRQLR